jgi:hypothetical protein
MQADDQTQDGMIIVPSKRALPRTMPTSVGLAEENGHYTRDAKAWA